MPGYTSLGQLCEVCLSPFEEADLEDGCTQSADCCDRVGLCRRCLVEGEHDCDEGCECATCQAENQDEEESPCNPQ